MTFRELQDAVLKDAFAEARRADVKRWINFRLGWVWDLDDWTFTQGTATVTVTAGTSTFTLPSDFGVALDLFRPDGQRLQPVEEYRQFARRYLGTGNASSGDPEAWSAVGSTGYLAPTPAASGSYLLVYEKAPTMLSADSDEPGIPEPYHMALVHGAKAEGFKLSNMPLADQFDEDFQAAITAMRRKYLRAMRGTRSAAARYRPGLPC